MISLLSSDSPRHSSHFSAIPSVGICKALKDIDLKKSPSPDSLEPNLLKVAVVYIAE